MHYPKTEILAQLEKQNRCLYFVSPTHRPTLHAEYILNMFFQNYSSLFYYFYILIIKLLSYRIKTLLYYSKYFAIKRVIQTFNLLLNLNFKCYFN